MKQIIFSGRTEYAVLLGRGLMREMGKLIKTRFSGKKILVVTDDAVGEIYLNDIRAALSSVGIEVFSHVFSNGAENKTLSTAEDILVAASDVGLSRKDAFLALGGGVVHDITGFSASIYRRGAEFISVPTSLIAMTDASVGGKVWCNLPSYTDMVGAYKEPTVVVSDVDTLNTLPERQYTEGMSEIIKTAALINAELFGELRDNAASLDIEDVVLKCLNCKKSVLESGDENKSRRMLDFGNTVGQAIEGYYGFSGITHGQAVAIGMVTVTDSLEKAGIAKSGTTEALASCLNSYSLPTRTTIPCEEIAERIINNIKQSEDAIILPAIFDIGKSTLLKLKKDEVLPFIEKGTLPAKKG